MDFILPYKEAEALLRDEITAIREKGFFDWRSQTPLHPIDGHSLMLGLLVARTATGEKLTLRAFSGQLDGAFNVPSFTPPCFSEHEAEAVIAEYDSRIHCYSDRIEAGEEGLLGIRASLSNECLMRLRALYTFYSPEGKIRFEDMAEKSFPTGTGDCAGIKLLSYCFKKGYEPVSLAEIYFGSESHTHTDGELCPPCDEKCRPILKYILGLDLIYSDEDIAVISKPDGMLSVPGRGEDKTDSASVRMKKLFPSAPELPSVHRLDMDTSGVMVFAKTEEAKRELSRQFEMRETEKIYVALVRGVIKENEGVIDLPLRLDVDNRPYQIVDQIQGKKAVTEWRKLGIEIKDGEKLTRLELHPKTGRTHQLRVHSASGLGHSIKGDRLYGTRAEGERLCLHAKSLTFTHPRTGKRMTFTSPVPF